MNKSSADCFYPLGMGNSKSFTRETKILQENLTFFYLDILRKMCENYKK